MGCESAAFINRYGFCIECDKKMISLENFADTEIYSAFKYEGPVKEALHRFKYLKKKYYGKKIALFLEHFLTKQQIDAFDIIIPVPLHWKKEFRRGFNQCAVVAFCLSKRLGKRYVSGVLVKSRNTASQTTMKNREGRENNVKGSFSVKKRHLLKDKRILLLDDVYTSGATIREAKNTLLKNGAKKVNILVIAQA
ncbi:MAG: ComF family protein [Elusimicrobia bacterium]|nr:ComF family protein [Elusimicrobiota bacterium]